MNWRCGGSRLFCCATGIPPLLWISAPRQQMFCAPESTSACTPSHKAAARVYTALLPVEGTSKGLFHAWNAAQSPSLPVSRIVSAAIVAEMQKREFPAQGSSASLRPLNNVFMPAVAVELAPGANGVADLTS